MAVRRKRKVSTKTSGEILTKAKRKKIIIAGQSNIKDLNTREKLVKKHRKKTKDYLKNLPKRKTSDCFLCIDMSKKKPGFCIMENDGKILTSLSYPGATKTKALEIILLVEDILDEFNPDFVIFEATFSKFKRAAAVLSLYQGIVYTILLKRNIPVFKIGNQKVKAEFGTADKEHLFKKIVTLYRLKGFNFDQFNDETDAIAMGLSYLLNNKSLVKFE